MTITKTGNGKVAVVGWGRGMGHKGHMYLASSVITLANKMKADPYFFISTTVGKDDPLFPEEKTKIYQAVFPQKRNIFQPQGNLNTALTDLAQLGYQGVVLVVGADQKNAFQYLVNPNKEGVPVYQTMGLEKMKVVSRQETGDPSANLEGPRATPMREILLDPNSSEEQRFKVWRDAMPDALSDDEIIDLMKKAEIRLVGSRSKAKKINKIKEYIEKIKPLLEQATGNRRERLANILREANEYVKKTNTVASLIYNAKPIIFSRFGDEYVMDLIEKHVEKNPNLLSTEIAASVIKELNQGIRESISKKIERETILTNSLDYIDEK